MPRQSPPLFVPDPTVDAAAAAFSAATGASTKFLRPPPRTHYAAKIQFQASPHSNWSRPVLLVDNVDRFATLAAIKSTAHIRADDPSVVVTPYLRPICFGTAGNWAWMCLTCQATPSCKAPAI